jgi:iron complex transport system substrate-binding protein
MKGKMLASILALCLMVGISAADFTLHVYGNANMDDVIDERDIEYARGIMDGTERMTDLADVNGDGKVDEEDIRLIEEIIDGTAAEIKVIDSDGNTVSVKVPEERIVIYNHQCAEILQILGAEDQVAGVRHLREAGEPVPADQQEEEHRNQCRRGHRGDHLCGS